MFSSGARAVSDPIGIDLHEVMVSAEVGIDESLISPGGARVRDKDVKAATEFAKDFVYRCFHFIVRCDIDLVRSACLPLALVYEASVYVCMGKRVFETRGRAELHLTP